MLQGGIGLSLICYKFHMTHNTAIPRGIYVIIAYMINTRRWLTIILGLLALMQIGNILYLLQLEPELAQALSLSRPIAIAFGILWAGLFVWGISGLMRSRNHNRAGMIAIGFIVYSVARLAIFAEADYDRERVPFLVVGSALIILFLSGVRFITAYLKEKEIFTYDSKSRD